MVGIAVGGAAIGVLLIFVVVGAAKGCGGARIEALEARVAKLEGTPSDPPATQRDSGVRKLAASHGGPKDGDRHAACAVAKVAAYDAWQEAAMTAKKTAAPAEAQCADMWSEKKKQSCYYAATAPVRATQSARDAVMKGGVAARDASRAVKEDPKNEGIAKARLASEAALAACSADDTSADLR